MALTGFISLRAAAKINLFLHILDRLPDGYHRIFSLMQMVGLYDQIQLKRIRGRQRIGFSSTGFSIPKGSENLAVKAARIFLDHYAIRGGVEIKLHNRIPVSAGLGGGSSDAAATLRGLCRLLGKRPEKQELIILARTIGSDVPFFLSGPSALVQGTGEDVRAIRPVGQRWVVLVNSGGSVSTAWAYKEWDKMETERRPRDPGPGLKFWLTLAKNQNKISADSRLTFQLAKLPPTLHNDLEEAAERFYPVIGTVKERLHRLGAEGILMSGSGPTASNPTLCLVPSYWGPGFPKPTIIFKSDPLIPILNYDLASGFSAGFVSAASVSASSFFVI